MQDPMQMKPNVVPMKNEYPAMNHTGDWKRLSTSGKMENTSSLPENILKTMSEVVVNERCPYCDKDRDEISGDLGKHVIACQPFRVYD